MFKTKNKSHDISHELQYKTTTKSIKYNKVVIFSFVLSFVSTFKFMLSKFKFHVL